MDSNHKKEYKGYNMLPIEISKEKPKGWNKTAIECYNLKCNCTKCNIFKLYFSINLTKCKMKYYVIEMLKEYGKPKNEKKYD